MFRRNMLSPSSGSNCVGLGISWGYTGSRKEDINPDLWVKSPVLVMGKGKQRRFGCDVLASATKMISIFWDLMPHSLVEIY
jgi:hypothetical protein